MKRNICIFIILFLLSGIEKNFAQQDSPRMNNAQRNENEVRWVNPDIQDMEGLTHHISKSKALGCEVGYVVWIPPDYAQNDEKRYPVIYFLHGMTGNETSDAAAFSHLVSTAIKDGLLPPVICVFPNGGISWYTGEVEKMFIEELIPTIDHNYRTISKAQSRALAGFSMGGYGSVYLSIMYPELFCATGSFGGRLRDREQILSAVENSIPVWKKNNHVFFFSNGDNDHPEEFKELSDILNRNKIENHIMVLSNTRHDLGKYYRESSRELFKLFKAHIKTE